MASPQVAPHFPQVVDSTALVNSTCERAFMWSSVEKIRSAGDSIHLHAGACFAAALQAARLSFYRDGNPMWRAELDGLSVLTQKYGLREPLDTPAERAKAYNRVADAYLTYLEKYPFDQDPFKVAMLGGQPAVEFNFAIPSEINNPDTGEPVLIAGRADWIADNHNMFWVVDEKTCRAIKYPKQGHSLWVLRSQFMCYAYAAHYYGWKVEGTLVREIALQIEDIKLSESMVYAEEWRRDRWWKWANRRIKRMVECYLAGEYEFNFGDQCTSYGGCPYFKLCAVSNPHDWKHVGYVENTWNPLEKRDGTLVTLKV